MFRVAFIVAIVLAGCRGSVEPDSSSRDGEDFLRCAEPKSDGQTESFRLPPLTVERKGHDVDIKGIKRGLVILGVIAGIFEPSIENVENLKKILEHFQGAGVQAILVVGGIAGERAEMADVFRHLARAPIPILAVPGADEHYDIFRQTVAESRKTTPQLLDMIRVRRVRIGHVTLISLPGYYQPFYLRSGERGCAFQPEDIEKTLLLMEDKRTNVLISPTPPRGTGPQSVDRSRVGVNGGYDVLARELEKYGLQFGIFGHFYESGGHATLSDGVTAVAPGIWQESLYLQAGAAEALPQNLVGEGASVGMAQIVEISGSRARFRTVHLGAAGGFDG